jgi:biotin-(acetyl-CoA carboxylase) ligase
MKWVNDIFLNGKKIGGVLPRVVQKGEDVYLTIGIGVNIGIVPQGFEAQATCLIQVFERPVEIAEFF